MSKRFDEFSYQVWKKFDKLLSKEMPDLSLEVRVELANCWDAHMFKFEQMYTHISECYHSENPGVFKQRDVGYDILWGADVEKEHKKEG